MTTITREESLRTVRTVLNSSVAEGIFGAGALALAVIGLAGAAPQYLASIAVIAIGMGLLFQGAALTSHLSTLVETTSEGRLDAVELGAGMTAELFGGAVGLTLGILGLVSLAPEVLLPVAALVYGASVIVGSRTVARLRLLKIERSGEEPPTQAVAHAAVSAAVGVKVLVGLGALTLGILGLIGFVPFVLSLVAMLGLGFADLFSSSALTRRMYNLLPR